MASLLSICSNDNTIVNSFSFNSFVLHKMRHLLKPIDSKLFYESNHQEMLYSQHVNFRKSPQLLFGGFNMCVIFENVTWDITKQT